MRVNLDNKLVDDILSGNMPRRDAAYKQIYNLMGPIIMSLALSCGLDESDAEDILQETIIDLDTAILNQKFLGKSSLSTYIYSIARNKINSAFSKIRVLEPLDEQSIPGHKEEPDPAFLIEMEEKTEMEKQVETILHKSFQKLRPVCQDVIRLFYYEQKTMALIAEELKWKNANRAKREVFRCRKRLRKLIQKQTNVNLWLNVFL